MRTFARANKLAVAAAMAAALAVGTQASAKETTIIDSARSAAPQGLIPQSVAPQAEKSFQVAQGCGWYIILGCSRSRSGAQRTVAGKMGAPVLYTNNYPNFRNGWYCAYQGDYSTKSEARSVLRWWKKRQRDAYVKRAC